MFHLRLPREYPRRMVREHSSVFVELLVNKQRLTAEYLHRESLLSCAEVLAVLLSSWRSGFNCLTNHLTTNLSDDNGAMLITGAFEKS